MFLEAIIRDSEIRRSIVDQQTSIESVKLADAIIWAHTKLNGN